VVTVTVVDMHHLGILPVPGTDGVARIKAEIETHRAIAHSPGGLRRSGSLRLVPARVMPKRPKASSPDEAM
jgi:hypothetical protein